MQDFGEIIAKFLNDTHTEYKIALFHQGYERLRLTYDKLIIIVCKVGSGLSYLYPFYFGDFLKLWLCVVVEGFSYEIDYGFRGIPPRREGYGLPEARIDKDVYIGFFLYFPCGGFYLGFPGLNVPFREGPVSRFYMTYQEYFGVPVKFPVNDSATGFFVIHQLTLSKN